MKLLRAVQRIEDSATDCSGVFTLSDLAAVLDERYHPKRLDATVHRLVKEGLLERVRRGLFLYPRKADGLSLHRIAAALAGGRPVAVSLESGASAWDLTTQMYPRYLSVVTTAPAAHVHCSAGTVRMVHTAMPGYELLRDSVSQGEGQIPLARRDLVIHNLKRTGRSYIIEEEST